MRFLVTGGAGYVGSHFVHTATKLHHTCLVYDSLERGHAQAVPSTVPLVVGNIHDANLFENTLLQFKPDVVLHYAAYALVAESVAQPEKYFHNNVKGVENILSVLAKTQPQTPFVFSSSCAVFGTPTKLPMAEDDPKKPESPYGESKLQAEEAIARHVKKNKSAAMALRYFNACGADASGDIGEAHEPETHLLANICLAALTTGKITIYGNDYPTRDKTCVRDYVHVTDLALSHLKAAEYLLHMKDTGVLQSVHLGTGQGYSNLEIVTAVQKLLAKISDPAAQKKLVVVFAPRRPGDPPELYADNSKAKNLLNFVPQHSSIENIVTTAWRWHERHPNGFM